MRDEAEKRIGQLYPKVKITAIMAKDRPDLNEYVGEELTVIAWLWARTIECPNPGCRARTPLVRSFWLSSKKGKECYAKPILDRDAKSVRFDIASKGVPPKNTTDRTGARCLFCETFVKKGPLREIAVAHGLVEIPLAIVAEGEKGRLYLPGNAIAPPDVIRPKVPFLEQAMTNDKRWFSPPLYGMPNFADLFTSRQLVALTTFSDLVQEARERILVDTREAGIGPNDSRLADGGIGIVAYADAVATYLAFGVDKSTLTNCTLAAWQNNPDRLTQALGRQALPMTWDFAEANPLSDAGGGYVLTLLSLGEVLDKLVCNEVPDGRVDQLDASVLTKPGSDSVLLSSDPPYYDNIGYADLSDWFYLWLRRSIGSMWVQLFSTLMTPKKQELIASAHRHEGEKGRARKFFEEGLEHVFRKMRDVSSAEYPLTVYYAFRQAETDDEDESGNVPISPIVSTGWETMLAGLVRSMFAITGTWPFERSWSRASRRR